MDNNISKRLLGSASLFSLSFTTTFSQSTESVYEGTFVLSLEDCVKSSMMDEYIYTSGQWIKLLEDNDVKTSINTFHENDDIVNYLEPLSRLDGMDEIALYGILKSVNNFEAGQKRKSLIR